MRTMRRSARPSGLRTAATLTASALAIAVLGVGIVSHRGGEPVTFTVTGPAMPHHPAELVRGPVVTTTTTTAPVRRVRPQTARVRSTPTRNGCGLPVPPILDRIAWCESHCSWTVRNKRSSAAGLFQIIRGTFASWQRAYGGGKVIYESAADAPVEYQIAVALAAFNAQGSRPWMASRSCWGG